MTLIFCGLLKGFQTKGLQTKRVKKHTVDARSKNEFSSSGNLRESHTGDQSSAGEAEPSQE